MATILRANIPVLLVALAAAVALILYLQLNPTPTVYAVVFFGTMMLVSAMAAVVPWRSLHLGVMAFVAAACFLLGSLTMSGFGFVLLGLAGFATITLIWLYTRVTTATEALSVIGGGLMGLAFFITVWSLALAQRP